MMTAMLVPVNAPKPGSRSAQAIAKLYEVDPEFIELAKMLYGEDVEPATVWAEAFGKMNPAGPDMATSDSTTRRKRAVVATASAIGAGAGALGFAEGVRGLREARRLGKPVRRMTKGLLAIEPVGLTGEIGATHILGGDVKNKKQQPVAKAIPGLHKLSAGIETGMRRLLPGAKDFKAGFKGNPGVHPGQEQLGGMPTPSKAARAGGVARTAANATAGTPKRRAATAVVGGGLLVNHKLGGQSKSNDGASGPPPSGLEMPYPPSYYDQIGKSETADVEWSGEFSKFDDDKRLAFGWASVVKLNGVPVVDRQGDYITPEDLEDAAYSYVKKSGVGGSMHRRNTDGTPFKVSDLVESVVFTPEKIEKMGLDPQTVPCGWWVGFHYSDDNEWSDIKKGLKAGFSIHGRGKRVPVNMDELVDGYT